MVWITRWTRFGLQFAAAEEWCCPAATSAGNREIHAGACCGNALTNPGSGLESDLATMWCFDYLGFTPERCCGPPCRDSPGLLEFDFGARLHTAIAEHKDLPALMQWLQHELGREVHQLGVDWWRRPAAHALTAPSAPMFIWLVPDFMDNGITGECDFLLALVFAVAAAGVGTLFLAGPLPPDGFHVDVFDHCSLMWPLLTPLELRLVFEAIHIVRGRVRRLQDDGFPHAMWLLHKSPFTVRSLHPDAMKNVMLQNRLLTTHRVWRLQRPAAVASSPALPVESFDDALQIVRAAVQRFICHRGEPSRLQLQSSIAAAGIMCRTVPRVNSLLVWPTPLWSFCRQGVGLWQYPLQFARFLEFVLRLGIRSYLELGVAAGGSFVWIVELLQASRSARCTSLGKPWRSRRCRRRNAFAIAVDPSPVGDFNGETQWSMAPFRQWLNVTPCAFFMQAASHTLPTLLPQLSMGRCGHHNASVDLAFIDAEHSAEAAMSDFMMLYGLGVQVIAMHDIVDAWLPGPSAAWRRIRSEFDNEFVFFEIAQQYPSVLEVRGPAMGIGVAVRRSHASVEGSKMSASHAPRSKPRLTDMSRACGA